MTESEKSDLKIIRDRLYSILMSSMASASDAQARQKEIEELVSLTVESPTEGGMRFSDVDYEDKRGASWEVSRAAVRVLNSAAMREYAEGEERRRIERLIVGHLTDFAYGGYVNPNWWHNEIGIPTILIKTLFLVKDILSPEVYSSLIKKCEEGSILCRPEILSVKSAYHTGGNLTSYCMISLYHACVTDSAEEIRLVVNGLSEETYGAVEGLQPDGSFFQHGRRLYSFGYGLGFLSESAQMFVLTSGTSFAFPGYAMDNVMKHLLDGIRYMIGGCASDVAAMGRSYTRKNAQALYSEIDSLKRLLSCKEIPRRQEAEDLLSRLESARQPVVGVKYFENAKLLTMHTERLYVSFKGTDPKLFGSEICTYENYLSVNFSYGTFTAAMRTGKEYFNISPIWNYSYVPGTTSRDESDEELMEYPDHTFKTVDTDDFGGAQLGDLGVCFIGAENYGVRTVKSAVATPECMIILGAGITERDGKPIHTTVEQSFASGEMRISEDGAQIIHAGILYRSLDPETQFKVKIEKRTCPVWRNSKHDVARMEIKPQSDEVSGEVFTAYIDHTAPDATVAYVIAEEELSETVRNIQVIENTEALQAVRLPDGRVVAVYHRDGELILDGKTYNGKKGEIKII